MITSTSQFNKILGLLQQSMSVNRLRDKVIANNIVNADVPGFKRTDVNFESHLKRALVNSDRRVKNLEMVKADPLHFDSPAPLTWDKVQPRLVLDYQSMVQNNGSNVDVDRESSDATKNMLSYALLVDLMRFQFNQINMVIK